MSREQEIVEVMQRGRALGLSSSCGTPADGEVSRSAVAVIEEPVSLEHAVALDAFRELRRANAKFAGFHSAHEGRSVIEEELHELTEHVYANTGYSDAAYQEAAQVAAMGMKFMMLIKQRQQKAAEEAQQ